MVSLLHNKEYDVAADGEYEGFRKLIGYELDEYFEVYFNILNDKGDALIKMVKTKPIDFDKWPELSPATAQKAIEADVRRYIMRTYQPIDKDRFALFAFSNIPIK